MTDTKNLNILKITGDVALLLLTTSLIKVCKKNVFI